MNKSEFIRQHPDLRPKDLVTLGRKRRIQLSEATIRSVRAQDRKRSTKTPRRRATRPTSRKRLVQGRPVQDRTEMEQQFMMMVFELGIPRSRDLIDDTEHRLRSMFG